jgi:hypothetical protein
LQCPQPASRAWKLTGYGESRLLYEEKRIKQIGYNTYSQKQSSNQSYKHSLMLTKTNNRISTFRNHFHNKARSYYTERDLENYYSISFNP